MRINAENQKFTYDGREYTWMGGFWCFFWSVERGTKVGDVRMFGDTLFYAYMASSDGSLFRKRICWIPQGDTTVEMINECRKAIFS